MPTPETIEMLTPKPAHARDQLLKIALFLRSEENSESDPHSTRSQIMASAISHFAKKGYAGSSMRDIAASVGIKAASLYAHCPGGKEQLLVLSLHDIFAKFLRHLTQNITFEMSPLEQLTTVAKAHISWQLDFDEQAIAWDALVRQFGVTEALSSEALTDILEKQQLFHEYLHALVLEMTSQPDRSLDIATAIRTLCNEASSWRTPADGVGREATALVTTRVWWLCEQLLRSAVPGHPTPSHTDLTRVNL